MCIRDSEMGAAKVSVVPRGRSARVMTAVLPPSAPPYTIRLCLGQGSGVRPGCAGFRCRETAGPDCAVPKRILRPPEDVYKRQILGRAEMFASKNSIGLSALDSLGMGLGYTGTLVAVSYTHLPPASSGPAGHFPCFPPQKHRSVPEEVFRP